MKVLPFQIPCLILFNKHLQSVHCVPGTCLNTWQMLSQVEVFRSNGRCLLGINTFEEKGRMLEDVRLQCTLNKGSAGPSAGSLRGALPVSVLHWTRMGYLYLLPPDMGTPGNGVASDKAQMP